jgi:hypothetical protein
MCNFVLWNGDVCSKSPTKARCSKHAIVVNDKETALKQIRGIYTPPVQDDISCPCGYTGKFWNFSNHRKTMKHTTWASIVFNSSDPKSWKIWG